MSNKDIYYMHEYDSRKIGNFFLDNDITREFIDITITSPPYFDMKSYNIDNQLGYGQQYEIFLKDLSNIFKEIYYKTKKEGSLWIIADTLRRNQKLLLFPFDLVDELKKIGWNLQDIYIWKKDKTIPFHKKGSLRNLKEYVLFFVKSDSFKFYCDQIREIDPEYFKEWWIKYPERYNPRGVLPSNIWNYPIPVQGSWSKNRVKHSNPLPPKLIERILLLCTDLEDVVFDPFAGSGTVLAVSKRMNRKSFGFDLNKDYIAMFNKYKYEDIKKEIKPISTNKTSHLSIVNKVSEKIIKLRIMKFAYILMKKYNKIDSQNKIINLIIIANINIDKFLKSSGASINNCVNIKFFLITNKIINNDDINQINKIIKSRPLTKFEINPNIEFSNDFLNIIRSYNEIELFTYTNQFYKYKSKFVNINQQPLSKEVIISNIKLYENIPKTWKSKKEVKKEYEKNMKSFFKDNIIKKTSS
jgi:DNA modification methylase